jgi:hypothetical protein
MASTIHALVLLFTIFLTLILIVRFGKPRIERVNGGILFPTVLFFAGLALYPPGWPTPVYQLLVPILCLSLVMIFMEPKILRRIVSVFLVVTALVLSLHFDNLTSTEKYTGIHPQRPTLMNEMKIKRAETHLSSAASTDSNSCQQGWLSESELVKHIPDEHRRFILEKYLPRSYYLWHSKFTGVYGKKQGEFGIWYPGGTLKEYAQKLEWKEKE